MALKYQPYNNYRIGFFWFHGLGISVNSWFAQCVLCKCHVIYNFTKTTKYKLHAINSYMVYSSASCMILITSVKPLYVLFWLACHASDHYSVILCAGAFPSHEFTWGKCSGLYCKSSPIIIWAVLLCGGQSWEIVYTIWWWK